MTDPFVGTWKLNVAESAFDAHHRPSEATMRWTRDESGTYSMVAMGVAKGQAVAEKPQTFIPDGQAYPVPGLFGLMSVTTQPSPNTIRAEARRDDGSIAGEGSYVVSDDGARMTATTAGFDTQLRRFELRTVWDRQ